MLNSKPKFLFQRLIEKDLQEALMHTGGVVVEGARFVGKTTVCKKYAQKTFNLTNNNDYQLLSVNDDLFNKMPKPILIDELQILPRLFTDAKTFIDESNENGVVIFTGSTWINTRNFLDPAAGRFRILKLNPLTLYESLDSARIISLYDLVEKGLFTVSELERPFTLDYLIALICRGGFPRSVLNSENSLQMNRDYLDDLLKFCLETSRTKLNKRTFTNLLSYCAILDSQIPNWSVLQREFPEIYGHSISRSTIDKYLDLLDRLFLVEFLPIYSPNLSSIRVLMTKPKLYFCDPAIAVATLSLNPEKLMNNLNYLGFLFENLVYRELNSYAKFYGRSAKLGYFLDSNKFEVDFILELPSGKYAAIEVKLGSNEEAIQKATENLIKYKKMCLLAKERATSKKKIFNQFQEWAPSRLIIITGLGKYTYKKVVDDEEIYVVPIQALMP